MEVSKNLIHWPTTAMDYDQYCFNRLPCGICQRTNQICPLAGNSNFGNIEITCNTDTPVNNEEGTI